MPLNLDDLREELADLNPQVVEADAAITTALLAKVEAGEAFDAAKAAVRALKATRDPLREQQMLLQKVIGDIDPTTPESQTVTSDVPLETSMADADDPDFVDAVVNPPTEDGGE